MKPFISLVVKPTLECNISCRHCYHPPEERVPGLMDDATLERVVRLASEEYETVWFIWHGGEPLLAPLSFFKRAVELQDRYFGKDSHRCGNTVQTNGVTIDRRFMDFCRDRRINVGVSYEGELNDELRQMSRDTAAAIDMMSRRGYMFSVSCTMCRTTAASMPDLYGYFSGRGINASFSPVVPIGCAASNGTTPDPDEYARASIETFDRWVTDSGSDVALLPHYLYLLNALGDPQPSDCQHTSCLTRWLSVHPGGDLYPCGKGCPPEFRLCNISEVGRLSDAFRTEGFARLLEGTVARREKCAECPIYAYCNGGCSMDAHHEGGLENNGGDSCRIYRQVFSHVQRTVGSILEDRPDLSGYNRYVRDAVVGKLVNPMITGQ